MRTSTQAEPSAASRARGVSLIEILIVLAVTSAVLLIAGVRTTPSAGPGAARAEAYRTADALRRVRAEAMANGASAEFILDVSARRYRIDGRTVELRPGLSVEATGAAGLTQTADHMGVRFYPNGSATGGEIFISAGLAGYRVRIDWLSGRVFVEEEHAFVDEQI